MAMQFGQGAIVLPPIGPLFAANSSAAAQLVAATSGIEAMLPYESEEERERHEADMARYFGVPTPVRRYPRTDSAGESVSMSMRTPTSVQQLGFPPSSSPVKKDAALLPYAKSGVAKTSLPMLHLDSPTATHSSNGDAEGNGGVTDDVNATMENGEMPSGGEDEKLRVSRERNRLHAQRTRIRKRELLENLKERIEALQTEHELLKQAYEFHASAVCLLTLGATCDHPCIQQLDQVGASATEDRDEQGRLCDEPKMSRDNVDMENGETPHEHEKSCACYRKDDADTHTLAEACTCLGGQLNANGKRPYSSTSSSSLLACSKEEREKVRRERNRLHARRARLRKKLILEKSQQAVHDLRSRNDRLRARLTLLVSSIYGGDAADNPGNSDDAHTDSNIADASADNNSDSADSNNDNHRISNNLSSMGSESCVEA